MPLNLPDKLPASELLKEENIFVIDNSRASAQDIRPLKIVILNLMPLKITTETDLVRLLSNTPLQLEISFMKLKSHTSKNTPVEHEITTIFDWARTHVTSTLYICWAAQAGLYHFYGVPKYPLKQKMFGIFRHHINVQGLPIFRGFDDEFFVPHSRHTEIHRDDILKVKELALIAESDESGVYMAMARNGREFFITGHSEYSPYTLDTEYKRDLAKGLPIEMPVNYYKDDNPDNAPVVRWRGHANLLFSNWLNYYVYQETPFDINQIR